MIANIVINKVYEPFFKTQKRFAILYGGSGSGKSIAVMQKLIMRAIQEPNTRYLMVRKYKSSIRESIFKSVKSAISEYGLSDMVVANNTEMSFRFDNGSELITSGLDDVDKLKSIHSLAGIWAEEAYELSYGDLTQLNLRLRGKQGKYLQICMSFNPVSELHWLKTEFFDKESDNVFRLKTTARDNDFLDDDYIDELEKRYSDDPNTYRVYVLGEFGKVISGGEWYQKFKFTDHVKENIYPYTQEHIHLSYDFNVNPYLPVICSQIVREEDVDGKITWNVNIFDEIAMYSPKNTTEEATEEFLLRYDETLLPPVYVYGDASGRSRSTSNNLHNYEIIESILKRYLTHNSIRVPKSNPSVLKRRQFINKILGGGYNIKINISRKCKLLIEDLEQVMEAPDGSKDKKIVRDKDTGRSYQKYSHFSDAFDYLLCEAFKSYYDNYVYINDR